MDALQLSANVQNGRETRDTKIRTAGPDVDDTERIRPSHCAFPSPLLSLLSLDILLLCVCNDSSCLAPFRVCNMPPSSVL